MTFVKPILIFLTFVSLGFAEISTYGQKAYEEAVSSGKPIVLHFEAAWCPVCKTQSKELETIASEGLLDKAIVFRVDIDTVKDLTKKMNASNSHIVVKQGERTARLIGVTDKDEIKKFLDEQLS